MEVLLFDPTSGFFMHQLSKEINPYFFKLPKTTFEIILVLHVEELRENQRWDFMQMNLISGSFDLSPGLGLPPLFTVFSLLYVSQHRDPVNLRSAPGQAEPFAQNFFKNSTTRNSFAGTRKYIGSRAENLCNCYLPRINRLLVTFSWVSPISGNASMGRVRRWNIVLQETHTFFSRLIVGSHPYAVI
jgi:hypothetical protein